MTKGECIAEVAGLPPASARAAAAFGARGMAMAQRVTEILATRPDLDRLIGPGNLAMMTDNHKNHARYMASVLEHMLPEQFVETLVWVYRAYRAHGFALTYWPAQLNAWLTAMEMELSAEDRVEIEPLYVWMLARQAEFVKMSDIDPSVWETRPRDCRQD